MIVPEFWAEARLKQRTEGRQITVRRYGWSDVSEAEAQANADARAREALARIVAGEKLDRRERKVAYNGADGLPIREQVLGREGSSVITRNAYGARCLNTPDVLFADIDFSGNASGLLASLYKLFTGRDGSPEGRARHRIAQFVQAHPEWSLRVYRTPAGLRLLATHRPFDPLEPGVAELFRELKVDPVFARMCSNQRCFRARLSPKPWRIGMSGSRMRPGVWPVQAEQMAARERWLRAYETASEKYAACQFVESLGSGATHPAALAVQQLHDEHCRAHSGLPLA
jgi:hypothetical protein